MFLQLFQNGLFSDLFKYFKSKDYLFKYIFILLQTPISRIFILKSPC
jgi:hypothetical protein